MYIRVYSRNLCEIKLRKHEISYLRVQYKYNNFGSIILYPKRKICIKVFKLYVLSTFWIFNFYSTYTIGFSVRNGCVSYNFVTNSCQFMLYATLYLNVIRIHEQTNPDHEK